jgi:hypothetical protein
MRSPFVAVCATLAGMLLSPTLPAGQFASTAVDFTPVVVKKMQSYGEREEGTLRAAILAAVARATGRVDLPAGLALTVTVQDVEVSHPTPYQMAGSASIDEMRSKFVGGADLAAVVRDADQHVLVRVNHQHFAPTLDLGSPSLDPWADARVAIDQFAVKLATACRDLPLRRALAHAHRRSDAQRAAPAACAPRRARP